MALVDPKTFAWLADAPLFIDAQQVERFYDAVIRPTYIEGATSMSLTESEEGTVTAKFSGEGKVGIGGGLLKYLFGGTAELKAGGEVGGADRSGTSEGRQTQWIPIRTPQRQLEQLVFTYLQVIPNRLLNLSFTGIEPMFDPAVVAAIPRAIVVLDLPGKKEADAARVSPTRLIPMAAEFDKGGVVLLYRHLREVQVNKVASKLANDGTKYLLEKAGQLQTVAGATSGSLPTNPSDSAQKEQEYWEQFLSEYDCWDAMKVVEDATIDRRIRWIDFRIPLTFNGHSKTFHLHVCPVGEYDTGVFAYNFIQRGFEFGVRLVGTLKAGSDINVLAIYEK